MAILSQASALLAEIALEKATLRRHLDLLQRQFDALVALETIYGEAAGGGTGPPDKVTRSAPDVTRGRTPANKTTPPVHGREERTHDHPPDSKARPVPPGLTIAEVAALAGLSVPGVHFAITSGALTPIPTRKLGSAHGRRRFFDPDAIETWVVARWQKSAPMPDQEKARRTAMFKLAEGDSRPAALLALKLGRRFYNLSFPMVEQRWGLTPQIDRTTT